MKQKLWLKTGLFILIIVAVCLSGIVLASDTQNIGLLWESLAGEDYQQALQLAIEQGQINPVYFELAYYLEIISFNSSQQFHQISQELYAAQIDSDTIEVFMNDMEKYLPTDTPLYKLVEAIIQFNEHRNQAQAIKLVEEALREKETTLGYYLQYAFCDNIESLKKAALLAERPGFLHEQLMFLSYNQELNAHNEVNKERFVPEIEELLSSDDYKQL